MRTHIIAVTSLAACLSASAAFAGEYQCQQPESSGLFNLAACVKGESTFISTSTAENMVNELDTDSLQKHFVGYNDAIDETRFDLDFRGVLMQLSSAQNETAVHFKIDKLNIDETFTGASRDQSMDNFEEYIKKNGDKILAELVKVSAIEPIAGNPSSLQAQMVDSAFGDAMFDSNTVDTNQFGIGMRFGRYTLDDKDLDLVTLPLSYSKKLDSGDKLMLRLPISYSSVDSAKSYRVAMGASYKRNVNERWALTPGIDYGIVGAPDLGSVGQMISASLTSDFSLYTGDTMRVGMGNMVGYYRAMPLSYDDYNLSADISNMMFRNGILVSVPLKAKVLGQETSIDMYLIDTRFTGDDLYTDNYQEIGIVFGPRKQYHQLEANTSTQVFGVGFKYLYSGDNDISGFELAFSYRF